MDVGKICWPIKPLPVKHHSSPVEILKTAGLWQGNTDTGPSEQEDLPVFKQFIVSNLLKNSIHVLSCPARSDLYSRPAQPRRKSLLRPSLEKICTMFLVDRRLKICVGVLDHNLLE